MSNEELLEVNHRLNEILSNKYMKVDGESFYRYIFPNNENEGEWNRDYSKPNAIYLYKNEDEVVRNRILRRRIMLNDTWESDYQKYVKGNSKSLCSGLTFRGRVNRLEHAQQMNALIFDIDSVGLNELDNMIRRFSNENKVRRIPIPTFIVSSGTGVHLYYVLEEPIDLFPNIKLQLKALKYNLTYRFWDYKGTSQDKNIQYQPLNQAFRMVGSINEKYGTEVQAYLVGERVPLERLNEFATDPSVQVDINQRYKPSKYTLEEAQEHFPEWYERVIIQKDKTPRKWRIKRDLYDWWKRQYGEITGGHRYYYLMCLAIYAVKCDIPRKELETDMYEIFEELKHIPHSNELCEEDIISALEAYDRGYYNFKLDDIEKLTGLRFERNKRNYRSQGNHIKIMNAIRDITYPNGEWRNKDGAPTKENLVKEYLLEYPDLPVSEVAKNLGVSRTTVYKYKKDLN